MLSSKQVDLDALIDPELSVKLDGETVPVRPIDGASYRLLLEMKKGERDADEAMWAIAGRCLPSISEERVLRLTASQVGAIVNIAKEDVEKVLANASPNSEAAATRSGTQALSVA